MKKMFKTRASMFHVLVVLLFALLFTTSCIDEAVKPDNSDTKDKAEYSLSFANSGGDLVSLKGENVNSNWDPELGIVWLGNDENNLPTGTLTIFIDKIVTSSGRNQAYISSVALTTVDQLTGTGAEINGKTYLSLGEDELRERGAETGIQWIDDVEIGENYISGRIGSDDLEDENWVEWQLKEVNTGEIIGLVGTFTAIVSGTGR